MLFLLLLLISCKLINRSGLNYSILKFSAPGTVLNSAVQLNLKKKSLFIRIQIYIFTTLLLKALSDQVLIRYQCFVSLNCLFSFGVSLRKWLAHSLFWRSNWEIHRNEHFSSTFLIRLRFQRYRCKSDITIFVWRGSLEITVHLDTFFPKF